MLWLKKVVNKLTYKNWSIVKTKNDKQIIKSASVDKKIINYAGKESGWLLALSANDLISLVQGEKAVRQMFNQSRLSAPVFERDFLSAMHKYAEYVQLMPASESHHHAHAGGLLSHTIEMLLAAMTWRNGHLLPQHAPAEMIDEQRDQWTYVIFFAALLHDIAKPMTDLRILWRGGDMVEPIHWKPIAGSINAVGTGRHGLEYRVEFEPKSARDYQAHSRLAISLLSQIAPPTALRFLANTPTAFDALTQYLSGEKTGLVGEIIKRADSASTSNSLMRGSKARFPTAQSIPLVDLLMQAIKNMLQVSTELPLNRSGAAGWVYDGSIWFVAKRLADSTRIWIKTHEPSESVPGEAKNDRLFDTWQEYGVLTPNPATGQAIWTVTVIGESEDGTQYEHQLSMLRFPLKRLYDDSSFYPPAMGGRIEVRAKSAASNADKTEAESSLQSEKTDTENIEQKIVPALSSKAANESNNVAKLAAAKPSKSAAIQAIPAPKIPLIKPQYGKITKNSTESSKTVPPSMSLASQKVKNERIFYPLEDDIDEFDVNDNQFLDEEDVASIRTPVKKGGNSIPNMAADAKPTPKEIKSVPTPGNRKLFRSGSSPTTTEPVVLKSKLPDLKDAEQSNREPSEIAIAFLKWLQGGLASRSITYNEAGAPVHFVDEGMALVSPLIFKRYASEAYSEDEAAAQATQVQRDVLKAGWHKTITAPNGSGRVNILRYEVIGRSNSVVAHLSAVVFSNPDKFVLPVPQVNPVLKNIS